MPQSSTPWSPPAHNAALALDNGTHLLGFSCGAHGIAVGELCFNTAMTGYQEILTDPSYAKQIVVFSAPHIGNVGANPQDHEHALQNAPGACGAVFHQPPSTPSNYRAQQSLSNWLHSRSIIAVHGLDTRSLVIRIRTDGMARAVIASAPNPDALPSREELVERARSWNGMEGSNLVHDAASQQPWSWDALDVPLLVPTPAHPSPPPPQPTRRVALMDYGSKANIPRALASFNCDVRVFPPKSSVNDVLAYKPHGLLLSNGPGDPVAAPELLPAIRSLVADNIPTLGVCFGHQLLALAFGASVQKMSQGHHGANHPVQDLQSKRVLITSMNHGFVVADPLPDAFVPTHVSLFDGSNCGLRLKNHPAFSVQHHPEASPGPHDAFNLFSQFRQLMDERAAQS